MISVIVFSKNRPLQLEAYLGSLLALSDIHSEQITIILDSDELYLDLIKKFPFCNWIKEKQYGGFDKTFRTVIDNFKDDENILFGVDDGIFVRGFPTRIIELVLKKPEVLCFSLRLGRNIEPKINFPQNCVISMWKWPGMPGDYGYPIDLMCSIYKAKLIKDLCNLNKQEMKCPNFFESFGTNEVTKNYEKYSQYMTMFNTDGYFVCQDVSRVQDYFPNKIQGTEEHSTENLIKIYKEGKKLDFQNLFNMSPSSVFVGRDYWKILD